MFISEEAATRRKDEADRQWIISPLIVWISNELSPHISAIEVDAYNSIVILTPKASFSEPIEVILLYCESLWAMTTI